MAKNKKYVEEVVNEPEVSETPSVLVAPAPEDKPDQLSPNPTHSGFTKQLFVDSLPESGEPNVLYCVAQKSGVEQAIVGYKNWKWDLEEKKFVRVYGSDPLLKLFEGQHGVLKEENNPPSVAPEKIFVGEVVFIHEPTIEGKKLHEFIDLEGGVTQQELVAALQNYYTKNETYNKTETNNLLGEKQDALDEESAPSGVAIKLLGFDSQGKVVSDNIPSGVLTDDKLDNESTNAIENKAVADVMADAYDSTKTYNVDDFVLYDGSLYKCKDYGVTGAWDSTKWVAYTVGKELTELETKKANKDGNYPTLTVGLAYNLDTKIVVNDVDAYNYRPTGGLDTETGNECKEKAIVGGSLGFNQLANFADDKIPSDEAGITYSSALDNTAVKFNGTATASETRTGWFGLSENEAFKNSIGHRILLDVNIVSGSYSNGFVNVSIFDEAPKNLNENPKWITTCRLSMISQSRFQYGIGNGVICDNLVWRVNVYDLTAMFGSTIADYIYSLEQGHAGAGVAWFKKYFNKPYYPYTPIGGFTHVITRGKKAVGFNQLVTQPSVNYDVVPFNKSTFTKLIAGNSYRYEVQNVKNATSWRFGVSAYDLDGNLITDVSKLNPSATLYSSSGLFINNADVTYKVISFTPTEDCYIFVNFCYGNTSSSSLFENACLHFTYDGERDGEYEPYREEIYENDAIELIGIPQIDNQGNLYFDGNRYLPSGVIEEQKALYTFTGSESWTWFSSDDTEMWYLETSAIGITPSSTSSLIVSNGIKISSNSTRTQIRVKLSDNPQITSETNMNSIFASGVQLIYQKATPTTSQASSYPETQWIANWGTEERLPPLNDTRPCEVPVGHDTDYPLDLKSKLEIMANSPSADGDYVLHSESGVNTYTPLGAWLSSNGWVKLTDISGYDATKTQTLKNVNGTLTWVDD